MSRINNTEMVKKGRNRGKKDSGYDAHVFSLLYLGFSSMAFVRDEGSDFGNA